MLLRLLVLRLERTPRTALSPPRAAFARGAVLPVAKPVAAVIVAAALHVVLPEERLAVVERVVVLVVVEVVPLHDETSHLVAQLCLVSAVAVCGVWTRRRDGV